jgi:hypothetical protein
MRLFQNFSFETVALKKRGFVRPRPEKPQEPVKNQPGFETGSHISTIISPGGFVKDGLDGFGREEGEGGPLSGPFFTAAAVFLAPPPAQPRSVPTPPVHVLFNRANSTCFCSMRVFRRFFRFFIPKQRIFYDFWVCGA